jgi:beta-glucanase (GH16 family)
MIKKLLIIFFVVLLFSCADSSSGSTIDYGDSHMPGSVELDDANWSITFQDDFEGTGDADSSKWEQQEYNRRNNDNGPDGYWDADYVSLDGSGNLDISVDEIDDRNGDGDSTDYATAMVRSKGYFSQTYGKFEASCQLPEQSGWWVAFWLFPDDGTEPVGGTYGTGTDGTEIDIMEAWGWTDSIQSALHYDGYGDQHVSISYKQEVSGVSDGFHTYSLVWTPAQYVFYVDDVETYRVTDADFISHVPSYVKLTGEILTADCL